MTLLITEKTVSFCLLSFLLAIGFSSLDTHGIHIHGIRISFDSLLRSTTLPTSLAITTLVLFLFVCPALSKFSQSETGINKRLAFNFLPHSLLPSVKGFGWHGFLL